MTSDWKKTIVFVALAALTTSAAVVKMPDRSGKSPVFNDQGEKFFPAFEDPNLATTLEVVGYDEATATATPFKVTMKDGKWVIPSHHDYPADAKQRLVDTATGVIGLSKDTVRSDRVEDHEAFGVLDPLDTKVTGVKGFGKRVTIKDASDRVLADFIIGKEVKDKPEQHYVRVPGQNRTYGVNVKADLSTRFGDWIETNLLKLDATRIRKIVFDNHKVDPEQGRLIPGNKVTISRKDSSSPWTIDGDPIPPGKELDTEKVLALTNALGDLKIVGVRPKPEGLTRDIVFGSTAEFKPTTRAAAQSLISKGFYPTDRGLLSNQGQIFVYTEDGAEYILRYGEVVFGVGDELTAGTPSKKADAKDADKTKDAPKAQSGETEGSSEGRYLFVTAILDPTSLPPPPAQPVADPTFPEDPFQYAPGEAPLTKDSPEVKERQAKDKAARDKQVEEAQKKVQELTDRFSPWYYVTPGESFRSIVLDRSALIRDKSATPPGGAPGGIPGLPPGLNLPGGAGGLPPGFNPHGG